VVEDLDAAIEFLAEMLRKRSGYLRVVFTRVLHA
jgi:hypothetical protein